MEYGITPGRSSHQTMETSGDDECERRNKAVKWRDQAHHDGLLEIRGNSPKSGPDDYWQRVAESRMKSRAARLLASCIALAFATPFLTLGAGFGKVLREQNWSLPAQTWGFTEISPLSGGVGTGLKQWPLRGPAYSLADGADGRNSTDATEQHVSPVEISSNALQGADMGAGKGGDGGLLESAPKSIWRFGPFVMFVGVIVSLLAKLLLAQPCAKLSTDALRSVMKAQLEAQGETRPDLEQGGATCCLPSEAPARPTTPPLPSVLRKSATNSVGSSSRSSTSSKWNVTVDIPGAVDQGEGPSRSSGRSSMSSGDAGPSSVRKSPQGVPTGVHPKVQAAASESDTFGALLRKELEKNSPRNTPREDAPV